LNKNIPEFFVKKNNSDPIVINPVPMEEIMAKCDTASIVHTFRKTDEILENSLNYSGVKKTLKAKK